MEEQNCLHHVGFVVSNLDQSVDFYTGILGFTLKKRWKEGPELVEKGMDVPGASLELAHLTGYGFCLELMTYLRGSGSKVDIAPNHVGVGHISLGIANFEEFVTCLRDQGVRFVSEVTKVNVGQWVFICDPDGIRIEIMGRL